MKQIIYALEDDARYACQASQPTGRGITKLPSSMEIKYKEKKTGDLKKYDFCAEAGDQEGRSLSY